jgi:hypothetical protein
MSFARRLQASSAHLRLYPADALRTADRTTLRKVQLDAPIGFAAPFASARGPGLVCISADGLLSVRSPACCLTEVHCPSCCLLTLILCSPDLPRYH